MKEGKRECVAVRKMMLSAAASTSIDRGFYDIDRSDVEKTMVETEEKSLQSIEASKSIESASKKNIFETKGEINGAQ